MDQFLREINSEIYFKWISLQQLPRIKIEVEVIDSYSKIHFISDHSIGCVTLYPNCIFEQEVRDRKTQKPIFYIHFQMANMKHAVKLFNEMVDCIYENCSQPLGKILLCCSGGLTTSLFASQMETLAHLENLNYVIKATGYGQLYEIGSEYDLILLAPQVSYMLPIIRRNMKNKIIEEIPTKYFARNDYKEALDFALALIEGGLQHEDSQ